MRAGRSVRPRCTFALAALAVTLQTQGFAHANELDYPKTPRVDQVDDFHGTAVADPYRWLENVDDPKVVEWVEAQNRLMRRYVDRLESRDYIVTRLKELADYTSTGLPVKKGDWVFFSKKEGLQNHAVLYKQKGMNGRPEPLLDPNALDADGRLSIGAVGYTRDGKFLAYAIHKDGSDWATVYVKDVRRGTGLDDRLERVRFTDLSWAADNSGFYYSRYPEDQEHFQALYFHRIGDPQAKDRLVYERPESKDLMVFGRVTDDGRYLVVDVREGTKDENEIIVKRLDTADAAWQPLFTGFEHDFEFVESQGDRLFFETDQGAPRRKIVMVDLTTPDRTLTEVVPEHARNVLLHVALVNGQLAVVSMHNAYHRLQMYSLLGELQHEVELPSIGAVASMSGNPSDGDFFVAFYSFLTPQQNYRYDFDRGQLELFQKTDTRFDPTGFVSRQIFYESKDGTKIPMFLVHKRGLRLDGDNPVMLYGYGGFASSRRPSYSTTWVFWLEQGGVLALPNLRGGGEFGEEWHRAGMLGNKQNVFDDFIAAAEWLVANGYTSPGRIAIEGGSNGGLLTAACALQRPGLFGTVLSRVPVIDMLRYTEFTIGSYWVPEYGDPQNPEHFKFLYAYSPLHNVRKGAHYPAMIITTADTDTRVHPAHAKKFAAAMQANNASNNPILLRVETKAGHGAGKPTTKWIEERADLYAFTMDRLGMEVVPAKAIVEQTPR